MVKRNAINRRRVVLLILDGWGLGRPDAGNPIHLAKTPFLDSLYRDYSWTTLCASGKCAGLPTNQVGNSEAGHINLGAGRIADQEVVKISKQINTGQFFKNPAFVAAISHTRKNKSAVHLMGLLSNGQSPHSDPDHLLALLTLLRAQKVKNVYLHLFTDGRDSPPRSSLKSMMALERFLKPHEVIATVIGRFYAMDRKKAWDRTVWAYEAMTVGRGHISVSPQAGITRAYNADITDEFIEPIVIQRRKKMVRRIENGDAIIFFNLRSDRARQLAKPFVQQEFERKNPGAPKRKSVLRNIAFVAMTDFGPDLDSILTAYPSADLRNTLPMMLHDFRQLYIAESEKYAHVTFFFNGGYADPVAGEKRVRIPSPRVTAYDQTPAMSMAKVAQKLIASLKMHDFICANFAAPDMIGHTGNIRAGIRTAEAVDKYVKKVAQACLKNNVVLLITADHGNLESMLNLETKEIITEHTTNPVPLIIVSKKEKKQKIKRGYLGDVAPTILNFFDLQPPAEMTRKSLI
ncbi:MAG TPA: 2,3-bisphosphoglycerate-independent phosphoglycerate mutase [bacterium]|nr:2,3-bisphosphoglycerate-independent phosphoglycerate mutase [bacterium]HNS34042.1 2,3-bisphosphoglycerate-independent phosphoglycerate mutase [bacterium]HNZ73112.1 2,3-bisphosphoglycerate-independent phosphoglycerate mutase [bacterium]